MNRFSNKNHGLPIYFNHINMYGQPHLPGKSCIRTNSLREVIQLLLTVLAHISKPIS